MSVAGLERMTIGSVVKRLTLSCHTSRQIINIKNSLRGFDDMHNLMFNHQIDLQLKISRGVEEYMTSEFKYKQDARETYVYFFSRARI